LKGKVHRGMVRFVRYTYITEKKIKGIMTRAKAKWRVEGERCNRYFCNLEKRNFVEKTIPNLTLDDGRVIEDIKLNLSEQKEYYKNLCN
jgi:hypothetical protein